MKPKCSAMKEKSIASYQLLVYLQLNKKGSEHPISVLIPSFLSGVI